jgi:hypothetical protein
LPCGAEVEIYKLGDNPITISTTVRGRREVWNWFQPGRVSNGQDNHQYDFQDMYVRAGIGYQLDGVKSFVELMSPTLLNLPDDSSAPAPAGALGLGANYYIVHKNRSDASVFLKQGYLQFKDKFIRGLYVKGGRFGFADGTDLIPEVPQLKWLVLNRIQQRLIGPFTYTDIMRSFDGAMMRYGHDGWNFTAMYGVPTKGAFDLQGMDELKRTDLFYAALNFGPNQRWGNSLGRLFYIYGSS